jgi:tetratricopeptide (TPR) repeat protein
MRTIFVAALTIGLFSAQAEAQIGRVAGTIRDEDGRPVKGATIVAENRDQAPSTFTASSDAKGRFSILGMRRGRWTFTAQAPGFEPVSTQADVVTVRPNPPLDLRLERSPTHAKPGPLAGIDARALQRQIDGAEALADKGELDAAITAYRELLIRVPALTSVHLRLGELYEARHDVPAALAEYQRLAQVEPGNRVAQAAIDRLSKR